MEKSLIKGPRGGLYYEINGKRIYVKEPENPSYSFHRKSQPSSGWSQLSPHKGRERARLYSECDRNGKVCFLKPDEKNPGNSGFPICEACRDPNVPCSCNHNCKGIVSAYVRAREWKHDKIAEKARSLENTYRCSGSSLQKGGFNTLPGLLYESNGKRFEQNYCPQPPPCPSDKPLRYKMRGREGKGYSREELLEMYKASL